MPELLRSVRSVLRLLAARDLTRRGQMDFLRLATRRKLGRVAEASVHVGDYTVYLGDEIDSAAFWYTFVLARYGADYRGAVVLDIGAHKGYFGAFALARAADIVLSFEPASANFAHLRQSAAESGREWRAHQLAVGQAEELARLVIREYSWGHSLYPVRRPEDVEVVRVVPMRSVLEDAARLAQGRPVIVKMNAEGAECQIVLGTPVECWRGVAEAFVAVHDFARARARGSSGTSPPLGSLTSLGQATSTYDPVMVDAAEREAVLGRIREICLALPETSERLSHGAPTFFVRGKRAFLMVLTDHHGDGRFAIWCAAPEGVQQLLVEANPERFFVPPYVGHRGWLGARLDRGLDWNEVAGIAEDAYAEVAPVKLVEAARVGRDAAPA